MNLIPAAIPTDDSSGPHAVRLPPMISCLRSPTINVAAGAKRFSLQNVGDQIGLVDQTAIQLAAVDAVKMVSQAEILEDLLRKRPFHHGGTEEAQSSQRKSSFNLWLSASICG